MDNSSQFDRFISDIRLTDRQQEACIAAHKEVRERLTSDSEMGKTVVSTFLQGSYVRHTITKPYGDHRPDVDVIVVTKLSKDEYTPSQAINQFKAFLEAYYPGRYKIQGRSIGISFPTVDLDLVITAAPSESVIGILKGEVTEEAQGIEALLEIFKKGDEWKSEPLLIPDRDAGQWVPTSPLEQIEWTKQKNEATSGNFVNVVKVIKRWRDLDGEGKRPKGFLIERLVGEHCPDGITSVAEGVEASLRGIKDAYGSDSSLGTVPNIPDTGVPTNNVFKRLSAQEFRDFYGRVRVASAAATNAYNDKDPESSGNKWRSLFGEDFPSDSGGGGGSKRGPGPTPVLVPPAKRAEVRPGRFA